jgi:signal transduction histidine kinase
MPEDVMVASMAIPLVMAVIVKGAKWEATLVGCMIICATNLFTMYHFDLANSLAVFVLYFPVSLVVLFENQRQNIKVFLLSQNQENLLLENERLAEETHANELRHMIGNVAHDLKTPLSAFVSGMDFLTTILSEASGKAGSEAEKASMMKSVMDSIHNMKNVNEFMLMTINRCIDYTKASQGLKLVPRMETINFAEAINLPLRCMKDMQHDGKIEIILTPIAKNITENIITDKQWLQENILCLLSNAVKFSTGGVVVISAALVMMSSQPPRNRELSLSLTFKATRAIRIEIEDSGIGISEDMMNNLFNPFKQAQRLYCTRWRSASRLWAAATE